MSSQQNSVIYCDDVKQNYDDRSTFMMNKFNSANENIIHIIMWQSKGIITINNYHLSCDWKSTNFNKVRSETGILI